jgi:hypothetical protein
MVIFKSPVISASLSGSLGMQSHQCSLLSITFSNISIKINDITGTTMKNKANATIWFIN